MSARDTKVTCPCCESLLEVDTRTGAVLRWKRPTELDETGKPVLRESDWEQAQKKVGGRLGQAEDKFQASLDREKGREDDLDDLFRKAKEKLERRKDVRERD